MGLFNLFFGRMIDKRISAYQNDLITKHCNEVENIYRQMRGWRHDYHNHIQAMKAHLALRQIDELAEYLGKLDEDLTTRIHVNAKATVPAQLKISEIDLCVIIGNLLDNAVEACLKQECPEDRFIRVYIGLLKDQLYLSISNSAGGAVKKSGRLYLSTKDSDSHGFGLLRVDRIVEKYAGYLNRQNEEGVFATEIMLPL